MYGFGSASLRFQNEVYGCHLPFGRANKAVIELADSAPVDKQELGVYAPSRMLPEFAASFKPAPGRTFAHTVSRDAPPAPNGEPQYWVQPKDLGGLFPGGEAPPVPFAMQAPRGAGAGKTLHQPPTELLTPAERREALVFDKAHMRARHSLRKAAHEACGMTYTMQQRYPNGVLGLEGPGCADSQIYAEARQKREAVAAKHAGQAQVRFDTISASRDTKLDYRLCTHDHANISRDVLFQAKRGSSLGIRGEATAADPAASYTLRPLGGTVAEVGFRSNQEKPLRDPRVMRTDNLRNVNTRGRGYDVISGAQLATKPSNPSLYEMPTLHDRRAHPSNLSLPHRSGTAPTLIGPIPDAHVGSWQPPSPTKSPSKSYLR